MSKVQLFAVDNTDQTVLLKLSDESPIKINLSVTSLDAFAPSSYYSQTFTIPGQGSNVEFFKDVFSVNGYNFDASKVARAWINSNGFLFSVGNLNLKSVTINEKTGFIQYEVFFMGDTSDLSSSIGNNYMDTIDTQELDHELTYTAVTTSWNAAPGATSGLKDGNVLYPLVEWGYEYDANNFPINTTISNGFPKLGASPYYGGSFTNGATAPYSLRQLKPAVRTKWIWDKIFADAGFTYESEFLDSTFFDKMYFISDSAARTSQPLTSLLCEITLDELRIRPNQVIVPPFNNVISNPSNAYSVPARLYTVQFPGTYSFQISGTINTSNITRQAAGRVYLIVNGSTGFISPLFKTPSGADSYDFSFTQSVFLATGDTIYWEVQEAAFSDPNTSFSDLSFRCTVAPERVIVSAFFPPQGTTKKIDFVRGISKMFNLVFEPNKNQARHFKITPWIDWIRQGEQRDWTPYLDGSAETNQYAPFLDKERAVQFMGTDDADFQNNIYQEQYKRNYMFREFESGINLIRGTQEIKIPFAPTPLESIPSKTTQYPDWVIPSMAKLLPGDPNENKSAKVQPIQPKPRILFYNGKRSTPVNWYLQSDLIPASTGIAQSQYPLVSEYETFPPTQFTFDLTFQSKRALWSPVSTYTSPTSNDLWTSYWGEYIQWVYDPYNRIKVVTMRLNPYIIETLKFNDTVWVKDSWFFVNKVTDYPVGETALVKVELIKVPGRAIPNVIQGATGAIIGSCRTVAICNNNTSEIAQESYTYADCDNNIQTVYVPMLSCTQICLLYPSSYPLPAGWSMQDFGPCGTSPIPKQEIFIDFSSLGDPSVEVSLVIKTATGGTAGNYVPTQYYNTFGDEGATGVFISVPDGFGLSAELSWVNPPPYGFVEGSYLNIAENSIIVANDSYSGYYAGPLSVVLPTAVTGGNDYLITSFLFATGPFPPTGCPIWSVDTDTFGSSTTVWNECPSAVWNTDTDEWDLSTTIWNV